MKKMNGIKRVIRVNNSEKESRLDKRFIVITYLVIVVFVLLVSRLAFLQVVKGAEFKEISEKNRIRLLPIIAPRGTFYDRNGEVLVSSRPAYAVSIMHMSEEETEAIIGPLSGILNMPEEEIRETIAQKKATGRVFEPILIKRDVDFDTVTKIKEHGSELSGVIIDVQSIRDYKYGSLGSHLFGYVGEISSAELEKMKDKGYRSGDIIGKIGLESYFDAQIRGEDGGKQVEVDHRGRPISELGVQNPVPGNDLILTIDVNIQRAAEEAMREMRDKLISEGKFVNAKAGAAVAMDVKTGAILAMASMPDFDPNLFAAGISTQDWKRLSSDPLHVFTNRATRGVYPPASTFKIVTGIAALETGKVQPDTIFNDNGLFYLGSAVFRDWKQGGHGRINFLQGIAQSCNIVFYTLGRNVGIETLAHYARELGLGEKTGFILGEEQGRVPDPEWKKQYFKRKQDQVWYPGETVITAIGQGNNLYTILQLATMYSAIANGGSLYVPYVVDKIMAPDGKIVKSFQPQLKRKVNVSQRSLEIIRKGLEMVVSPGGTAYRSFADFPIQVAGKTGTAENSHGDDHGLFAGYAPADDPEIAVAVIIEQGGSGSAAAAPVARKIFEAAFQEEITFQSRTGTLMDAEIRMQ